MNMSLNLAVVLLLQTVQFMQNTSIASGWQGIVPLHSSRNDVEKLLGPPTERLAGSVLYRTKDETVIVFYSKGTPCRTKGSQWRVAPNTVETIDVTLHRGLPLSQLKLDEAKYKKKSGGHRPEDIYYVNEEKGEVLRVFNGEVLDMHYGPASSDKNLQCVPVKRL